MSVLSRAMSGVESIRSPAGGGANNTGQNMAPSREGAFGSVDVRRFANLGPYQGVYQSAGIMICAGWRNYVIHSRGTQAHSAEGAAAQHSPIYQPIWHMSAPRVAPEQSSSLRAHVTRPMCKPRPSRCSSRATGDRAEVSTVVHSLSEQSGGTKNIPYCPPCEGFFMPGGRYETDQC